MPITISGSGITMQGTGITITGAIGTVAVIDLYFPYVTLLLSGDGTNAAQNNTFTDSSTNNFSVTRSGTPTQGSFSPYGSNWSNYFSGTTDNIYAASNNALTIGTSNFTIEFWANWTAWTGEQRLILMGQSGSSAIEIGRSAAGGNNLNIYTNTSQKITASFTPTVGIWYHIALVRTGTGSNQLILYINGVSAATGTSADSISTNNFFIGGLNWATGYNMQGYISNVRFVNGTAVYTGNFTVPAAPLTITQSSSGANIAAITGSQTSLLVQATNGWTAELWVNPSGDYSTYRTIFAKRVTASATTEYEGYLRTGTGVISFYNGTNYESTTTLTANTWSHCAWVYDGTNIKIYVNGVQVYTAAVTITTNTEPLVIGNARGNTEYFLGYLSNFRFTRGQVYTGNFTPPTAPLRVTQTGAGNIAAITGNAASSTNLLVLQSSTYKDNSANNYLYGYTYTINTGTPIIKLDTSPFVDPALGLFAYGGGAGGFNDTTNNANTGGSGGGNWNPSQAGAVSIQPTTSYYNGVAYPGTGFGNAGGLSGGAQIYGAGGGGAGGAGSGYAGIYAGGGGIGLQYNISGVPTYYAGGGSSAGYPLAAGYLANAGGAGGGGTGDNSVWAAAQTTGYTGSTGTVNATANGAAYTGGGGGSGGAGGTGIVILRYLGAPIATGGTITSWGAYTIHTFTQSDTFTMSANISVGSSGGNGGPYAGGGGGAAGYLGFGGNGAAGSSLAAGNYGTGGGGGGSSGNVFGGGGGGVDIWGLGVSGGYGGAAPTGAAGNPGTGSSSENILGLTGNGAQPGFGGNGGLYGGGGGGAVSSSLNLSQGWGGGGAFALIYSIDSNSYRYPTISPVNLNYLGGIQTTNTTNFNSNLTAIIAEEVFDQQVVNSINYGPTSANSPVTFDYFTDNNTGRTLVTRAAVASNNVVAADITVTVNYQAEWMLVNSDPAFPATYDRAYNYQVAKPVTTTNDPRKLTLKAAYITKTGSQQDPTEPDQFL